ncbi:MAG: hypothetical protein U9R03_04425 [Candidatus Aerophobetes bacterium]|nr:hypothetical protein [Candidatus Aerophobetes bacterium]
MLEVVPYTLDDIKNELKIKAIEELGLVDAEFEGSNVSQLINLLAYAQVMNNTNLLFGLNEMFITQASDKRNVIKHARQMGYINKRKISYQYKIKLKALKTGNVLLEKYTKFTSGDNEYVYLGESISDYYGFYIHINRLFNEFNNSKDIYGDENLLQLNSFIITEEGQVAKILEKTSAGELRILLETLDNSEIPLYSNIPKNIYVWNGERDDITNYRDLTKVGTIDTFLVDNEREVFKVQVTPTDSNNFPIFTEATHITKVTTEGGNATLTDDTEFPIKSIQSILLNDNINIDISTITLSDTNNISFPDNLIAISELHTDIVMDDVYKGTVYTNEDIYPDSFRNINVIINDKIRIINPSNVVENGNELIIDPITTDNSITLVVDGDMLILPQNAIFDIMDLSVFKDGVKVTLYNYTINNGVITIKDSDGNNDLQYDGLSAIINYTYYEDMSSLSFYINYSYIMDISDMNIIMNYSYDTNADGYLDKRFFIDDLRGFNLDNEYSSNENLNGFDGFYASSYNEETNVLEFNIYGSHNMSAYRMVDNERVSDGNISEVLTTPLKKTRFSITNPIYDGANNLVGYTPFDDETCFASISNIDIKNELEIIVKEGNMLRWDEETIDSIETRSNTLLEGEEIPDKEYLYKELTVDVNQDMVDNRKFIIEKTNVENEGIEIFVTRILENGDVEYDVPWSYRTYLLSENEDTNGITPSRNFVALENENYPDYIDIYTSYANSGIPLSLDFIIKVNLLISKGAAGTTSNIITPIDNEDFEAVNYIEESQTPHILYVEGSDEEDTENIKDSARLYSNTANRAVTQKDYLTICNSQGFIKTSQIWGGEEELPEKKLGHIFFSIIPYSKPDGFIKTNNVYNLSKMDVSPLFFPTYYQITGKTDYFADRNEDDNGVLFNILNQYKIITLQLNYKKAIYIDYEIDVEILKYKLSQTINDTHEQIFIKIKEFFVNHIEKFDATFYESSLVKNLDTLLGDNFGLNLSVKNSVELYDDLKKPDNGTFVNDTMMDITVDPNTGISGTNDNWQFLMHLEVDLADLFEDDIVVNNKLIERGVIRTDTLINCTTENFIKYGDLLYMDIGVGAIKSTNIDAIEEFSVPSNASKKIEINIMYRRDIESESFKVGSYVIFRDKSMSLITINTHLYNNIDNEEYVSGKGYIPWGVNEDESINIFKECALPRTDFTELKRKLKFTSNNKTIKTMRNTFGRLTKVKFI